jgi:5-methylcytosine-specific restriction endonuclease McrA
MGLSRVYKRHSNAVTRTKRWKAVRFQALRRDGFKCVKCGATGCRLEVDHIKPVREAPELSYDLNNVQVLCVPCHSRKTRLEIGLAEQGDMRRLAWRKLVRDLAHPSQAERKSHVEIR